MNMSGSEFLAAPKIQYRAAKALRRVMADMKTGNSYGVADDRPLIRFFHAFHA